MVKNSTFPTNKTHLKPRRRRKMGGVMIMFAVLFIFLTIVLMIDTVIAFEFDNVREVKDTFGLAGYRDIEIQNAFGLGSLLWSGTLDKNTNRCGQYCESIQTITLHEEGSLVDEIMFKTKQDDNSWIEQPIRNYQIYIKTGEVPYQVEDYETQCTLKHDINGTDYNSCKQVKVGEHTEYEKQWSEYVLGTEMNAGSYEVKLEGEKKPKKTVDWIYKTQGETLEEWAVWGASSLGTGLTSYYSFENNNESLYGLKNLSALDGQITFEAGLIGNAGAFSDVKTMEILNTDPDPQWNLTSNTTINVWLKKTNDAASTVFASKYVGAGDWYIYSVLGSSALISAAIGNPSITSGDGGFQLNLWNMISIVINDTNASLYVDGTFNQTRDIGSTGEGGTGLVKLGDGDQIFEGDWVGLMDEMGTWNRSLSSSEISDLYNGGAGLSFTELNSGGNIVLNSPINYFNSSVNDTSFNATATIDGATLVNMSLFHNATGTWERNKTITISGTTNTSEINQSFNIDGNYLWGMEACDSDGDCGVSAENRTLIIDLTDPSIIITNPVGLVPSFVFGNTLDLNWTISDLHLDSCWFEYNLINTTLTCLDNTTTFLPVVGAQSLRVYANDSAGNIAFEDTSWTYGFLEQSATFDANVYETASEDFKLNLTTSINILSIDSFLVYNNTVSDRSTVSCTDDGNCTITNTIDIPLVNLTVETQNKSFFWNITIFNGTDSINIETSQRVQNVTKIHFASCDGTFTTMALNFTAFDEETLAEVKPYDFNGDFATWLGEGTIKKQTNISELGASSVDLCITPNKTHFIDGQVTYNATSTTNYTQRDYYFQNNNISNVSQDIELGLLKVGSSTSFILKVQDTNILPVPDVLIFIQRFYPGLGVFKTVQVAKTDDNGGSVGFFKTETVDYRFILKQNNVQVLQTEQQKIIGESVPFTLTFTIGEDRGASWEDYEEADDLETLLTYNKTSQLVTFIYLDTSNKFISGNLTVLRLMTNGTLNELTCSKISAQSSATLICNMSGNATSSYSAQGIITRSDDTIMGQLVFKVTSLLDNFTDVAGDYGLFLGWFVILLSCFAFKFNEIAGIFMINVAVIGVNIIGLISFGPVFITSMIALSIFIAVVLER